MLLCSDVMDYCRKVSSLEDSKNGDQLLKKLVCVCVCVCVCGWKACVCVGRQVVMCVCVVCVGGIGG